jgi:T4 bacteriophage base plate protein
MLPKIEYPIYDFYVKSVDRRVKFRPFLVKEEKILLMAKESKDPEAIRLAIRQIIQNCLVDNIDVDKLPLFDVEMIFLKLRAKSVGETVKLVFNCKNEVDGVECNTDTDYTLDLEKVVYEIPEGHDPKIMLTDKLGIKLKYPDLNMLIDLKEDDDEYTA